MYQIAKQPIGVSKPLYFGLGYIVSGVLTPALAKHTKHLSLVDVVSIGVDRIQPNFEPMKKRWTTLFVMQYKYAKESIFFRTTSSALLPSEPGAPFGQRRMD